MEPGQQTPCPFRVVDDTGSAFAMGAAGGAVWHFFKGMKNSPRGDRVRGGYQQLTLRAPTLGGNFAVWGGLFSSYDCALQRARQREDPWNAVAAGALTGGTLAFRAGPRGILTNAMIGGVLLAIIEGLGILVNKAFSQSPQQNQIGGLQPMAAPLLLSTPIPNAFATQPPDVSFTSDDFSFNDQHDFDDDAF